ncbi:hypothetical protein [Nonomuraea rhizosphaerae]|uniref:hypothetical protein n=1 Tax=Nonomuraea rhizosphaerae TaxID=2665663 RepID=UPI001C5FCF28|nr:hypothetical protein [Nonomuraea rhizosphaerae]
MARWRKALVVASVGLPAAVGLAVLHVPTASAAPADLQVDYRCTATGPSSIVRHGPVRLTTRLTFDTDLVVGDPLNFTWKLDYANDTRMQSPGYFAAGAQVHAVGNVKLESSWQGILQPKGAADQETNLRPDDPLSLPETLTDPGLIDKPGTIKVTPQNIVVDFTPPDGEVIANDGNEADNPTGMQIVYGGPGNNWVNVDDRPGSEHHVHNDFHVTETAGDYAELTFIGTGVEYVGPRDKDAGPVDIYIDGTKRATVDPSRDDNDMPVNSDLDGGHTLWKSPGLSYGTHTIRIVSASAKPVWLDAFRVSTNTSQIPTGFHRATCRMIGGPVSVIVTVTEPGEPTTTTTPTDEPTDPPTTPTPTTSPSGSPTTSSNPTPTLPHHYDPGIDRNLVSVVPGGVTTTTATPRPTTTKTKYVKAQVAKTPKGGVDSGEQPEPASGGSYGLIASGSVLLMGSATGGLLLRRRKAGHAGGVQS